MKKIILLFLIISSTCWADDNLEMLISSDEIEKKVNEVALLIDQESQGEELTVIMVMKGAICITADLIRNLKTPFVLEFIKASSYGQNGMKAGALTIDGFDKLNLDSKNVLVVDDIFDSGVTMASIIERLKEKNPKTLKSLVLLSKKRDRPVSYLPDYVLFEIEDHFIVGYGLDYKDHYRGLSGIYMFKDGIPPQP